MPHRLSRFDALVQAHVDEARSADDGAREVRAEQMRSDVRRFLDNASLGWSTRRAMIQAAEDRMAASKPSS